MLFRIITDRKKGLISAILICTILVALLCGCTQNQPDNTEESAAKTESSFLEKRESVMPSSSANSGAFTTNTPIQDVINYPAFGDYGRLIFPVNEGYYSGSTLGELSLTWYSEIRPEKTVEICNYMKDHADAGNVIFYDIYTDEEKAADPSKKDTGLFFFRGNPEAKTAICNAGGGFAYVGAMHDSFPHALELSRMGYNAFALIYRPGWETAMEDLGRTLTFLFDHAKELEIDMNNYSLWGGSAGARMAATLGNADDLFYYTGRTDIPQASAVIMQYTGHSEALKNDAPTYACVGRSDGIASWRTMQNRLNTLTSSYGIPTEFHSYEGLGHGFGLGTGTAAEGWINDDVKFWETQSK
ncbi:MAG: alpha/beta hydrolase [Clostridia bacterium]|nr:alpha/beta hydrolase [Clostridia bacterium]